jgi:hypothetical protein
VPPDDPYLFLIAERARDTTRHSPHTMKMNQKRVCEDSQREPEQGFQYPPEFRVHAAEDNANRLVFH